MQSIYYKFVITPEVLNEKVEEISGIPDILGLHSSNRNRPLFGYKEMQGMRSRFEALLHKCGQEVDLTTAINFLMPSTTDFSRSWIGEKVADVISKKDPKVVTLGCSTGLEVYWIAYCLLKKGMLSENTKVKGVDINSEALRIARSGVYEKRYFDQGCITKDEAKKALLIDENKVSFVDSLKRHVEFLQGNITDIHSMTSLGLESVDVVLVMNVLKYMTRSAIDTVLENISSIISSDGVLFTDIYSFQTVAECAIFEPMSIKGHNVFVRKQTL
jgi:chemotaxis methyl-accepting protein methylase